MVYKKVMGSKVQGCLIGLIGLTRSMGSIGSA
jgi:hypothetical protein